ncbi:MAG: acetyl-CoA carboxylase biotin carboxyl carrier protein [Candidatus Omnitrophota bacterium]
MNLKEIKEMINLMNENNLSEVEVEKGDMKIKLKKSSSQSSEMLIENTPVTQYRQSAAAEPAAVTEKPNTESKKYLEIKSPIVGTFYSSPSPEAASFVEVGQDIEVGQVVCIIEAMKLMNEIKSEVKGKVVDILADNADPVEFGQILILVEPA